jgi:O-antigen/teichoic acid export membrane protein
MRTHRDGLLQHSLILMAATQVGTVANLLFHVVMGRQLDPPEYGVLSAMLGIILIIATPMDALRVAMAHYAALLVQGGKLAAVPHLVRRWSRNVAIPAVVVLVAGILLSSQIGAFFHLDDSMPVILTCFVLAGGLLMPILIGALQGLQSFLWMSAAQHIWGVVRLVAGALFVMYIAATAEWGLAGQMLGVWASVAIGIWGLWWNTRGPKTVEERVKGVTRYFVQSLLILAGFAVLMNADVVMVKHFFPDAHEAGLFARAATIGRTMVFLTMPIALAMFPKVASAGTTDAHNWKTLISAVLYVAIILVAAASLCAFFAWVPLWILYDDRAPTPEMIRLVRWVVCAMAPMGLTYLLMNFQIAQRRFKPSYILLACAAGYVIGVTVFHETVWQVVTVLGIVSTLSAVVLIAGLPWRSTGGSTSIVSDQP